jgi:hypothetical protein
VTELAVITPSYAPDFEICRDLNASVLAHTPADTVHHIITPRRDLKLFSVLRGPRTQVWSADRLLPKYMVGLPSVNFWLNLRRPVPPVRGWVMQQVVKLQAAVRIEADTLLLADSDVLFIRPVTAETFRRDGLLRFYRKSAAVDDGLPRHLIWHDVARHLLGIPRAQPPLPDYVSAFNVWDRRTVLAMRDQIQQVTGRPWLDVVAGQLHISEFILYGVFVDDILGERADVAPVESMLCHSYWDTCPLNLDTAERFVRAVPEEDVAVMISAKSHTPLDVRRTALSRLVIKG